MTVLTILFAAASVAAALLPAPAAAQSAAETSALQRRLADAGCYRGPVDGQKRPELDAAIKACPDQDPELRIETGMHTAPVRALAVDGACRIAATVADDKSIRLWSLPDGRLERVIRLPIADGHAGKMYAVAMSRDGRFIATGGWDGAQPKNRNHAMTLIDRSTGAIRRYGAFENTVFALAFSPDERRIAVGLANHGLRVLDRETGRELFADRTITGDIHGVAFAADGSLLVGSYDGQLRRYSPDYRQVAKAPAPTGKQPFRIALDPAGRRLAVGYSDVIKISIVDAVTLKGLAEGDVSGVNNGSLSSVGWSSDGQRLVVGGRSSDAKNLNFLRTFRPDGTRLGADVPVATDNLRDPKACGPDMVFAAADPMLGILRANNTFVSLQKPKMAELRDKRGDGFTVSPDAQTVRFGLDYGAKDPVLFDIQGARLVDAPNQLPNAVRANTDRLPVTDWLNRTDPKLAGKALTLSSFEMARAVAVQPDASGFALGTGYRIRSYSKDGTSRWQVDAAASTWGVNLSGDGRVVVAALGDGTIRWHRWSDGKELLALFVELPSRRWVAWTPSGYYMASPGGEDLIGWHVNRGWEQEADFFPVSRFRDKFGRPEVVRAILSTLDEGKAVELANAAAPRRPVPAQPVVTALPPVVTIVSPAPGSNFGGREVALDYVLRSPSGLAVDRLEVLIDGRPAPSGAVKGAAVSACPLARGAGRNDLVAGPGSGGGCRVTVAVPAQDVELSLIARAGELASEPARVRLAYGGQRPQPGDTGTLKPKLYVLAVGVADYVDPELRLGLAGKDAIDFAAALKAQEGGLYREVVVKRLVDREATRDSVLEGLEWLEREVTSRDVGVLFLAGHGVVDEGKRFWYLPSDANQQRLRTRGVSQEDIRASLVRLAGKAIMFLDACHAAGATREAARGAVDINAVMSEFSATENGVVVYGSSTGREVSLESAEWNNGAFTKAVVEAIKDGKADLIADGQITLSELDAYVAERVKTLTSGRQHPVMSRPATITNFPLVIKR